MHSPDPVNWNERYVSGATPWDSGEPSLELRRVLRERRIAPCAVLELGCGTGTNAVFLARRGFRVTAVDVSPLAVERARKRARKAGVRVRFVVADVLELPSTLRRFPWVFDRGVYHHLRTLDLKRLLATLERVTAPKGLYLTLAGNANEETPEDQGPPVVSAHQLCLELQPLFDIVQLREFRFDGVRVGGKDIAPLAWSALARRRDSRASRRR